MNKKLAINKTTIATFYPLGMKREYEPKPTTLKERILKDLKDKVRIDVEADGLQVGMNPFVNKEFESEFGLVKLGLSIRYTDDRDTNNPFNDPMEEIGGYEIELINVESFDLYDNLGNIINVGISTKELLQSLQHLNCCHK